MVFVLDGAGHRVIEALYGEVRAAWAFRRNEIDFKRAFRADLLAVVSRPDGKLGAPGYRNPSPHSLRRVR